MITGLHGQEEKQRISVSNSIAGQTSGDFQLWFNSFSTELIPWDASAEDVRAALMGTNSYLTIGDVDVSRTTLTGGYAWDITFKDSGLNDGDMPALIIKGDSLSAGTGELSLIADEALRDKAFSNQKTPEVYAARQLVISMLMGHEQRESAKDLSNKFWSAMATQELPAHRSRAANAAVEALDHYKMTRDSHATAEGNDSLW